MNDGLTLKQFFRKNKIRVEDAAQQLGVDRTTLQRYFNRASLLEEVRESVKSTFNFDIRNEAAGVANVATHKILKDEKEEIISYQKQLIESQRDQIESQKDVIKMLKEKLEKLEIDGEGALKNMAKQFPLLFQEIGDLRSEINKRVKV